MSEAAPPGGRGESRRPAATVLVPTLGRESFLPDCVRSIAATLGPDDELIVVEAVSDAATRALAALGPGPWRSLRVDRPGKSRQLNVGIEAARGEVIAVTDDDCRVGEDWLDRMAEPFVEPDVGIAFGPVHGLSEIPGSPAAPAPHLPGPAPPALWRYAHGPALAVRAAAAHEVGGFDERLGPGAPAHGEEADLALRVTAQGWRCWLADAPSVEHLEWRTEEQDVRNRLVFERGAGAWLGAAARRERLRALRLLNLRLSYQRGLFRSTAGGAHARAALRAFGSGLATGLRLSPKPAPSASGVKRRRRRPTELPWPAVRHRRCLYLGDPTDRLAVELRRRGPSEVSFRAWSELAIGSAPFDVVVAREVLSRAEDPRGALKALLPVCGESLLSVEPIALAPSLLARAAARFRRGSAHAYPVRSGLGHRRLLEEAGFAVQLASKPWIEDGTRVRAILGRRAPAPP